MRIKELFTRELHNNGIPLYVKNAAGKIVGWIQVRGLDSDAYRSAHDGYNQAMVRLAAAVRAGGEGVALLPATQEQKDAAKLAERVALVAGWSFEDACTPEATAELLRESPSLSDQIFGVACDSDRFLEHNSPASTDGLSTNSDSTDLQQQDQSEASPNP